MDLNMPEQFDESVSDDSRAETGKQAGILARGYFGSFAEVPFSQNKAQMIKETMRLIDAKVSVIAEASFDFKK